MAEDPPRKTPVWGVPIHHPRKITERGPVDRDRQTPKHGPIVPEHIPEDITGNYQGEELRQARARRPTDKRIEKLEEKNDDDRKEFGEFKDSVNRRFSQLDVAVADLGGQFKLVPELFESLKEELKANREELKASRENEHLVVKQTFDIGTREAVSRIETKTFAAQAKWKIALKIATGLTSAGVLGAIIALIAQNCG